MTKLIKMAQGDYVAYCSDLGVYERGDVTKVLAALDFCGVELEEFSFAIAQFEKIDHNIADFGVNRMCTYTTKVDVNQAA